MTAICPNCGFDLTRDEPMHVGGYHYDPRGGFSVGGVAIPLTPKEIELAGALFRARGRIIPYDALIDRLDVTDRVVISVHVRRIRKKFNEAGMFNPIGVAHGTGLFWGGQPFVDGGAA
ncbi:MAG: helix-turn-helix domain-containing protein [Sphingomonas sp.]|uniref:helix-turn-helix domain-containing protein n=1 Tax=Sphingomonas sp. TaxID=28214 RepID=UPI0025FE00FC|nr:helix-turn-helix domain-containing protein [Sphingomonas sp.]MBX9881266.1 helix-turn-helix domain-containing protein [Sphingomonas sp.]